jgi:hypothetical protein
VAPYSTIRLAMTLTYSPPRDRRKAMAAVSRPPAPRRLAENRVCEAEHLGEIGVSGNYHQIVGRRVIQDGAVSRRQQAHITDMSSLGP